MWEQIRANRRRSAVLITTMAIMLAALGFAGGYAVAGPDGAVIGIGVALLIWGLQMVAYATSADSILLQGTYAKELQRDDAPQLFNVVEEIKLASGLPFMPRLYLIDDPAPNAFAIGNKPETSAIAVTTGLLHRLNRDELQGVIGHEVGHLKNRDVQFLTLAAVMLGSIVILSQIVWRTMRFGGRSRNRSGSRGGGQAQVIFLVIALVFAILAPIMAQLLYFACSRKREYLADASSAQFTRYPEGLASALEKISQAHVPLSVANKVTAPMFIVNPLQAIDGDSVSLFATHPPTSERVRILRGMAGASFADYEAAYRKTTNGSCIGTETLRDAKPLPVRAPSDEGPIQTRRDTREQAYRAHGYLPVRCNCGLEINVPEGYEQDTIRCVRCGSVLPVPAATSEPSPQYTRTRQGWESFRCTCGRTIQLSPAFAAPSVRCNGCGRQINIQ